MNQKKSEITIKKKIFQTQWKILHIELCEKFQLLVLTLTFYQTDPFANSNSKFLTRYKKKKNKKQKKKKTENHTNTHTHTHTHTAL